MSRLIIKGGRKLKGIWHLSGNKNEALPLIAASTLFRKQLILKNLPMIDDVKTMMSMANEMGVITSPSLDGHVFYRHDRRLKNIPDDLAAKVRGSLLFLGPQLILNGRAKIPSSGGDKIGLRKIDHHIEVFRAFGCSIRRNELFLDTKRLNDGTDLNIWLSEPSVTATESAMMIASRRKGTTTIKNAACEPHVVGLGSALIKAGASISGLGTNSMTVNGAKDFKSIEHKIGDDFMEMGSLLALSAIFNNEIQIDADDVSEYTKIFDMMKKFGKQVKFKNKKLSIVDLANHEGAQIEEVSSQPWPSFPSDLMSVFIVLATQTPGYYLFHEKMFESRLYFTDQLKTLGAKLVLCDPHRVLIVGPSQLHSARLNSPDIRAGMALVIAALAAKGESIIENAEQLDRGYENLVQKLKDVGAIIRKEN